MQNKSMNIIGLILVGIGLFLLADNFVDLSRDLMFSLALLGGGIMGFALGLRNQPPRLIFPSAILLFLGAYLTLGYFDVFEIRRGLSISMLPIALASGFLASYFLADSKPEKLIFALFFAAIGASFLGVHFGFIPDRVFVNWVDDYWPLALIFAGIAVLISGFARRHRREQSLQASSESSSEKAVT